LRWEQFDAGLELTDAETRAALDALLGNLADLARSRAPAELALAAAR
jgi:hypothetical protein